VRLEVRSLGTISFSAVTRNIYDGMFRAIQTRLLPGEQILAHLAGHIEVRSSDDRFAGPFRPLLNAVTSQGHGTSVCTPLRLIAKYKNRLGVEKTVVFENWKH
jgi:hypothetical protein